MYDLQIGCIVWNVLLGFCILLGYYFILYKRIGGYNLSGNDKSAVVNAREWLWAGLEDWTLFVVWLVFAIFSTVAYLIVLFDVVFLKDWSALIDHKSATEKWVESDVIGFAVSNLCFLFFSAGYAPLVYRVFGELQSGNFFWSKVLVLMFLLCNAICAILMAYYISRMNNLLLACVCAIFLAVHCTAMDLLAWGGTWFYQNVQNVYHEKTSLFVAALDTNPSTMGLFDRLRIRTTDYGSV